METRGAYILIGSFVLAVLGLAFLFILWLGSAQTEYDQYKIVFEEQVSGLTVGGTVRFKGIQVGEVRKLEINDDSLVEALVRVEKKTPIKTDTIVTLEIVGFTGLAVIEFEGGSAGAPLLVDETSGIPVLPAQQSGISQLLSEGGTIIEAANKVLSQENIDNFSEIIANISVVTGTIAENEESIAEVLVNSAKITGDLSKASDDLEQLIVRLDALAASQGTAALQSVRAVADDARLLVADLRGVVQENRGNINSFTNTGLSQIGPGMTEVRRLLRTMDGFLKKLERDPSGYLLGEPVPEYKAKKK